MALASQVELRDLKIAARIGTYGPADVVPDAHVLDLTLHIAPHLVLVGRDEMALVFDYDPLIAQIDGIARAQHYQTQERLMTLIAGACAAFPEVEGLDMCLRKQPVLSGTGTLGVRLQMGPSEIAVLRAAGA